MPNDSATLPPPGHTQAPADRVDPHVVMPPHVLKAIAASTAAHTATYSPPNPGGSGEAAPPAQPNGATAQPPNGAAPPPAPPAGDEFPETNADGTPNWENRFKALKGRYDADTRRTRETQEEYDRRLAEMGQKLNQATRQPLPGETPPPVLVSQKEIEDYGADLIDVIKRAATEAVMPLLKPLATNLGQVAARIETTENETAKQFLARMHGSMNERVPGWADINKDEKFIAWTKRADVYSGLNRQEMLQKAWYAGDSNRVAAFFEGFLAEEAATDPAAFQARQQARMSAGGHAPGPASPAQPSAPRVTLEALAAPGRARAAATEVPAGTKPVWTAEGISAFYQDVARGVFRGREAERVATEADLMAAQREGRIQINPRTASHLGR